jgi:hypothetical protein
MGVPGGASVAGSYTAELGLSHCCPMLSVAVDSRSLPANGNSRPSSEGRSAGRSAPTSAPHRPGKGSPLSGSTKGTRCREPARSPSAPAALAHDGLKLGAHSMELADESAHRLPSSTRSPGPGGTRRRPLTELERGRATWDSRWSSTVVCLAGPTIRSGP